MNESIAVTRSPLWLRLTKVVILALVYLAFARLGTAFSTPYNHITLFWLPTGIAVAALLRWPSTFSLAGIALGALLTEFSHGYSPLLSLGSAAGMTAAPWLTVWLLRRWRFEPSFGARRDLNLLIVAASAGMLVSASTGTASLWLDGRLASADFSLAWLNWWLGDTVGVLLSGPLLLSFSRESRAELLQRPGELLLCLLLLALISWPVFFLQSPTSVLPLAFLPLPLIVWAALRNGVAGTSLAVLLLSAFTATGTALGRGVFGLLPLTQAIYIAWLYIFTTVLLGLMVTTMLSQLRRTKVALEQTNELLTLAQRETKAGVWSWDIREDKLTWSTELFQLFGLEPSAEGASFETWRRLVHPDDLKQTETQIEASLRNGTALYNEYRIVLPDNRTKWILAIGNTTRDDLSQAIQMSGLCFDITEHKNTQEQLGYSEALLRETQSLAKIGSWRLDLRTGELIWSDETYRIFGLPDGAPLDYSRFLEQVHPEDRTLVSRAWQAALEGAPYVVQHRIVIAGAVRWVEERAKFDRDAQHRIVSGTGSVQDITEQRCIEDSLRRERDQSRRYLNTTLALMVELNTTGEIVMINPAAARLLGYREDELIGRNWFETCLPQPQGQKEVFPQFRKILSGQPTALAPFENPVRCRDGSEREIAWQNTVVTDGNGRIVGTLSSGLDITARKRSEQRLLETMHQLEEKEQSKTRFLAAAGHDLRQPIAAATLSLEALKRTTTTHEQELLLTHLDKSMEVFANQLARLLDISKFDAGLVKPEITTFELTQLFEWLQHNSTHSASAKQLDVRVHLPRKQPLAVASDIGLLESALMNLVTNAFKFTHSGGILISARPRRDAILLQVWDTGIGIEASHLPHIFEEFYQVGNPQRDRQAGLGLGLSIAKRALTLLGATLSCRSRPGHGTVFNILLPLDRNVAEPATHPEPQSSPAVPEPFRGKRIVVLEDDSLVADALITLLQGLEADVRHYIDPVEALRQPDIADGDYYLVDYSLGAELSGLDFLNRLQTLRNTPVRGVILTGETSSRLISGLSASRWPILHKPASLTKITAALGVS